MYSGTGVWAGQAHWQSTTLWKYSGAEMSVSFIATSCAPDHHATCRDERGRLRRQHKAAAVVNSNIYRTGVHNSMVSGPQHPRN
jgi:hypothetical protein